MDIKATLKPGQKGTKRLVDKYGERLLCVRYRYDEASSKRYTTVELIEQEGEWAVDTPAVHKEPLLPDRRLGVRLEFSESDLRQQVKARGAIWRPRQKLWEMRYEDIVALGLESRVVAEDVHENVPKGQDMDIDIHI